MTMRSHQGGTRCGEKKEENSRGRYARALANLSKDVDGLKLEEVLSSWLFIRRKEGAHTNSADVCIYCIVYGLYFIKLD